MIRKEKDEYTAECNDCGTEEYGGTSSFLAFVDQLKDKGWKIKKDGDDWQHFCPDCAGKP